MCFLSSGQAVEVVEAVTAAIDKRVPQMRCVLMSLTPDRYFYNNFKYKLTIKNLSRSKNLDTSLTPAKLI
jgi:hypothetical protein